MNKEETIAFLTGDLRGRFLQYIENCYTHYQNLEAFLAFSKSPEMLQELEHSLSTIEEGINKAVQLRENYSDLMSLNASTAVEIVPILNVIDNWEYAYTTLKHVQNIQRKNFDIFLSCMEAGITEQEYNELFRTAKMNNLMSTTKKTILEQRDMISINSFSQLCYEL